MMKKPSHSSSGYSKQKYVETTNQKITFFVVVVVNAIERNGEWGKRKIKFDDIENGRSSDGRREQLNCTILIASGCRMVRARRSHCLHRSEFIRFRLILIRRLSLVFVPLIFCIRIEKCKACRHPALRTKWWHKHNKNFKKKNKPTKKHNQEQQQKKLKDKNYVSIKKMSSHSHIIVHNASCYFYFLISRWRCYNCVFNYQ